MKPGTKKKVFISYVQEDSAVAQEIAAGLEARGYSTWYYERDCPAGADYFRETYEVIVVCEAVLVLISPQSVESDQITREIVRAAEACKAFFPLLLDITHEKYCERRPEWRQAIAGANAMRLSANGGAAAIVPALVEGLKGKGIEPDGVVKEHGPALKIVILYKRNAHPDEELLKMLEAEFGAQGHSVFIDRHLRTGVEWEEKIKQELRSADAVIPLLSVQSLGSEELEKELRIAQRTAQGLGKPGLFPVRIRYEEPLQGPLGEMLNSIQYSLWTGPADNAKLVEELQAALRRRPPAGDQEIEQAGGAMDPESPLYVERPTDQLFSNAIKRRDAIILVKGPRQVGKTSLLARGLEQARRAGYRAVFTDFQKLNDAELGSVGRFYRGLAERIARRLQLNVALDKLGEADSWLNETFEGFLVDHSLGSSETPLVWGLDEVDRIFSSQFATQVFALFRSWRNERAADPGGPWSRFTMVICHATEPHLFIRDLNQSPFNVGTRVELQDFTREQVEEFNRRCNCLLKTPADLETFYRLVGGNPYLVHRGLLELCQPGMTLAKFAAEADREEGPYRDQLRRLAAMLDKDLELSEAVRKVLQGQTTIPNESFFRLQSAGVLSGPAEQARLRCEIYASYLRRRLL